MPSPKKAATSYEVRSLNTGALVCGPYTKKRDAERECERLNREAQTGLNAATGEVINYTNDASGPGPILHDGEQQRYEVVTASGLVMV